MKKIGIIAAMEAEIDELIKSIENPVKTSLFSSAFYSGVINGKEVIAVRSGIGKVNASFVATQLRLHFNADVIVMTGIAGGLGTKMMDTVVATGFVQHDVSLPGEEIGFLDGLNKVVINADKKLSAALAGEDSVMGLIATGEAFVSDKSVSNRIKQLFPEAVAVDMECGAVAQVCERMNVPFAAIKIISDDCNENVYYDFFKESSEKSVKTILRFLDSKIFM